LTLSKETIDDGVVGHHIWWAAKLGHSQKQYVCGLVHPLRIAETFEQLTDDYDIHPPARLKDEAKGGEAMLQAAHAAEAADEDAVGASVRSHLARAFTGHPGEEGDDTLRG